MRRVLISAVVILSTACSSPKIALAEKICGDAATSLIPFETRNVEDEGQLVTASYRVTALPRGGGKVAMVTTDIRAEIERGGEREHIVRDVGYFEDSRNCWKGYETYGQFFCYRTSEVSDQYANYIQDDDTRAFLSVLAFLATGGKADDAAAAVGSRKVASVPFDRLLEQTSAPSAVGGWYYCQACSGQQVGLSGPVSLSGIRFGRASDSIYFVTKSGWVARLGDHESRATYVRCKNS